MYKQISKQKQQIHETMGCSILLVHSYAGLLPSGSGLRETCHQRRFGPLRVWETCSQSPAASCWSRCRPSCRCPSPPSTSGDRQERLAPCGTCVGGSKLQQRADQHRRNRTKERGKKVYILLRIGVAKYGSGLIAASRGDRTFLRSKHDITVCDGDEKD